MTASERVRDIIRERSLTYGEPSTSMECLAGIWTNLLHHHYQQPLPAPITPHMAALMLAAMKVMRATMKFKVDNYDDASAFLSFAQSLQERDSMEHKRNGSPEGLPHA